MLTNVHYLNENAIYCTFENLRCKGRDARLTSLIGRMPGDVTFHLPCETRRASLQLDGGVIITRGDHVSLDGPRLSRRQAHGNDNGDWKNHSPFPFPLNIAAENALLGVWRWKHAYLYPVNNISVLVVKRARHGSFNNKGLKMAEFSPVLPPLREDGGVGRYGQPLFSRSRSGSESDSELSQSLARTKTRSYGSTASVTAPLGEKYIEHRVTDGDTLQGIALKYGVTVRIWATYQYNHTHTRNHGLVISLSYILNVVVHPLWAS